MFSKLEFLIAFRYLRSKRKIVVATLIIVMSVMNSFRQELKGLKMKTRIKKAFSLIELSIVILVIGILIAGVIQGSKMYDKFKIQVARSLTTSSPVAGIKDLMLWYETSLETSFKSTEAIDSTAVSTWYDNNPQAVVKNNATQATALNRPVFYENVLNGIPVVRFNGSSSILPFDGTSLVGAAGYTIFVVEQRRSVGSGGTLYNFFIGGSTTVSNENLHLGHAFSTLCFNLYGRSLCSASLGAYSSPIPRMHTFLFSSTTGKKYWLNGGVSADASNSDTTLLAGWSGSALGKASVYYFNGDIAEVIIYHRTITTEERQSVENYLSQKFAINITP